MGVCCMKWNIEKWKGKDVAVQRDSKGHFKNWGTIKYTYTKKYTYIKIYGKGNKVKRILKRKPRSIGATPPPPEINGYEYDIRVSVSYKSTDRHQSRTGIMTGIILSKEKLSPSQVYRMVLDYLESKTTMTWLDGVSPNRSQILYLSERPTIVFDDKPQVRRANIEKDYRF
jgi:hypothetical protein